MASAFADPATVHVLAGYTLGCDYFFFAGEYFNNWFRWCSWCCLIWGVAVAVRPSCGHEVVACVSGSFFAAHTFEVVCPAAGQIIHVRSK